MMVWSDECVFKSQDLKALRKCLFAAWKTSKMLKNMICTAKTVKAWCTMHATDVVGTYYHIYDPMWEADY